MTAHPTTFEEFWPFYVSQHANATNRALHVLGTSLGLLCLAAVLLGAAPLLLALAPLVGYGGAWIGHFGFEHNRPATFRYPLWSFRADFRMYRMMLLGRMGQELARCARAQPAGESAA